MSIFPINGDDFSLGLDNSFKTPIINHGRASILGKDDLLPERFLKRSLWITVNKGSKQGSFLSLSWILLWINLLWDYRTSNWKLALSNYKSQIAPWKTLWGFLSKVRQVETLSNLVGPVWINLIFSLEW